MLNHQHILTLYYVFSDCKKKYIALEYGEQTLLQKLQENFFGRFDEETCLRYLYEIALGMEFMH